MTLPPRTRAVLLTIHLVTAVGLVGVALVLLALGIAGATGADPHTVYPAAHLVEASVLLPLAVVALGTGVLQALTSGWGLLRHGWVTVKLVVTTALTLVAFLVLEPGLAAAADAATGHGAGPLTHAQQVRVALFPSIALALLLLNVVLARVKPTRRTRPATRRTPQRVPAG